jgi:hypothetical protein
MPMLTEGDRPPGFDEAEWQRALASGRMIVSDRAAPKRSRLPTPVAASAWFVGLIGRRIRGRAGDERDHCRDGQRVFDLDCREPAVTKARRDHGTGRPA